MRRRSGRGISLRAAQARVRPRRACASTARGPARAAPAGVAWRRPRRSPGRCRRRSAPSSTSRKRVAIAAARRARPARRRLSRTRSSCASDVLGDARSGSGAGARRPGASIRSIERHPRLDVDLRRRRRRHGEARRAGSARRPCRRRRRRRSARSSQHDVVARVAGYVLDPEALDLLPAARARRRSRPAPAAPRPRADPCSPPVEAPGALQQLLRVDQVRGADLAHVDAQLRDSAARAPRSPPAWSRWMWVSRTAARLAARGPSSRVSSADAGPGIDDQVAADLVGGDHPVAAQVHDVDLASDHGPVDGTRRLRATDSCAPG